VIRTFLFDCIG